ncbi:MAG TPA: autotransporter domain-containing protein [Ancylobacter sp.]
MVALDPEVSYQNGWSYTILTAQGGVTGSFADAVTASIFLNVELEQQINSVDIVIAVQGDSPTPPAPPAVFTTAAATANQFATASALDTLPQSGGSLGLYNALLFLTSGPEARYAFDQLSGEAYASTKGMFIEQSGLIRTAMIDRLRASFGAVAASSAPVMSYAELSRPGAGKTGKAIDQGMALKAVAAPATTETFALWATGFGAWSEMDGNINAASLSSSNGGFLIGADATLGAGWRLGVTGGYSYTAFDVDARTSSGDSENWHIGLYGGNQWGPLGLRTGLAYTWHDVESSRAVGFTGFGDYLAADYDAGTFQAFGELGYRIDTAFAVAFEPFANLAYVSLHTDGFHETGGAAALAGNSSDTDATFSTLGLRASTQLMLGNAATTLRGTLGWRHAFGDIVPLATQSFAGSEAFTVSGTPIAEDAALVEAGLDVLIGAATTLGVAYTGQFGDGVTQNGFNATLKMEF